MKESLFFKKRVGTYSDGWGEVTNEFRSWEDAYRDRWASDRLVRTTHGCDCSGSCSWMVHVKDGIVTWETQALDYPPTPPGVPNHEPRGCQRGSSYSWYLYSAARVKYPLIRAELLNAWRRQRKSNMPLEAWSNIVEDPETRSSYVKARGMGGFVRASWDEVTEIIASANLYTAHRYGPDRVAGFGVVPAPALVHYGSGQRYMSLFGGTVLSFFEWNCDLPPSSPQTWGVDYDAPVSEAWYYSSYLIVCGANISMSRCPDAHYLIEARYNGAKVVNVCPDYCETTKDADWWVPIHQGTDAALFMAMAHVIMKEFHIEKQDPYFTEYCREYTDLPYLITLDPGTEGTKGQADNAFIPSRSLRASDVYPDGKKGNADWKTVVWDDDSDGLSIPRGSIGYRWNQEENGDAGSWNILMKDGETGADIHPRMTFIDSHDEVIAVDMPYFGGRPVEEFKGNQQGTDVITRAVPVKILHLPHGDKVVATVFDLLAAYLGIDRGIGGTAAKNYNDNTPFTPKWQEVITGIPADDCTRLAREFATAASKTKGRASIIMGSGICQWFNTDNTHRSMMLNVLLCGTEGVPGGGWSFYVGQEKVRPESGWTDFSFAKDWEPDTRFMNSTSYFYTHTNQWKYERIPLSDMLSPLASTEEYHGTWIDYNLQSIKMGWLPTSPQLNVNPIGLADKAKDAGQELADYVAAGVKDGSIKFAAQDPDAEENWPRNMFIWRGNLLGTSGKGQEYFLKHLLGTQSSVIGEELGPDDSDLKPESVEWRPSPEGKLDLLVNLDFRMGTSGLYSDIVLPGASWYEKNDLNTTDLHSFINCIGKVVDCGWETKSDWDAFKMIAKKVSEIAGSYPGKFDKLQDVMLSTLNHDSPTELGQPLDVKRWFEGECDFIPGKTAPVIEVIERNYGDIYEKFTSIGPRLKEFGGGDKGFTWPLDIEMEQLGDLNGTKQGGVAKGQPLLETDVDACNLIMRVSPITNGSLAYRSWDSVEQQTGMPCKQISEEHRGDILTFYDLQVQPQRCFTSPEWTGIEGDEYPYVAYMQNLVLKMPWHTLTGKQQIYQDHAWMRAFGQAFPQYRPPANQRALKGFEDLKPNGNKVITLNFLSVHQKWGIHSTYTDSERMQSLSRGGPLMWMSDIDAKAAGIEDNDWVEGWNANGAVVARAVVSSRIPSGMCFVCHATEKTINTPGSEITGHRGGGHNAPTRIVLNPTHMIGGYAQQAYGFNYYGTVPPNRDDFIWLRRMEKVDWMDEEA